MDTPAGIDKKLKCDGRTETRTDRREVGNSYLDDLVRWGPYCGLYSMIPKDKIYQISWSLMQIEL